MDTRKKIVPASEASRIAAGGATVVSGYFDPLLASHAERLKDLKHPNLPLLVIVTTPERPILQARARAELLAGLKLVDYVTEEGDGIQPHYRLEEEHGQVLEELIAHVHSRQRS